MPKRYDLAKTVCMHVNKDGIQFNALALIDDLFYRSWRSWGIRSFFRTPVPLTPMPCVTCADQRGRRCARSGIRLAGRIETRGISLDTATWSQSNALLGEPREVPDAEADLRLADLGSIATGARTRAPAPAVPAEIERGGLSRPRIVRRAVGDLHPVVDDPH
jgi:hypothetical protein